MVAEDWKNAQNTRVGGTDDEETNINNVAFKFSFKPNQMFADIRMPVEYENIASFMEKVEAEPVISFDDLVQFDPLEQLDFEVMKYTPMPLPAMSSFEPNFKEKPYRPGCQYESVIRQVAGEPDLEKIQIAAHDQMELLKSKTKEIVSGANVAMPSSFLKPIDYSIDLLVRAHPTLRKYENQLPCTEVDPEFHLYPLPRIRNDLKDEIVLKNSKKDEDLSLVRSMSKSVGGAFINDLQISSQELPGNFGVRILETMPTNVRDVYVTQLNNKAIQFKCDYRTDKVPELLEKPDLNDYLTDEESDEAADFEIKVPELGDLINQFEKEDEAILQFNEKQKKHVKDLEVRGFNPEKRYQIVNQ